MSQESNEKDCSVRVAVRIRPQNPRDVIDMCRVCTVVTPNEPQIVLGMDKAFTFDHVYDTNTKQCEIYQGCVHRLVEGAMSGFNATVLAYGQTGSGKTHTMGTGFDYELNDQQQGIIPRAIFHIFSRIESLQSYNADGHTKNMEFSVAVQFIELYNEDIFDLLEPYPTGKLFKIHENELGQISVSGATIKPVNTPQEAIRCLQQGALARTTASTQMNDQSSRSHALFTILIRRQRLLLGQDCETKDLETLTSKFHFVDLAGSERLKRTGATGERAREGISINCGLLALGNCISALGDKTRRATHIPYRDSKLTRLLQDSLGGNSQTLMIACISPCDRDFMETLNTLKYANRARNIKNKVQINLDQSSKTIAQLRGEVATLQLELLELKQGKRIVDVEGNTSISDTFHENEMLILDNKRLQQRIKSMHETINVLTERNTQLQLEKEISNWAPLTETDQSVKNMVEGYLNEIEKLQAKLIESEEMYQQMKKTDKNMEAIRSKTRRQCICQDTEEFIHRAKMEIERDKGVAMTQTFNNAPKLNDTIKDYKEGNNSDESDQELPRKSNDMEDLEDINNDIEIKSRLIQQLELSQQRMKLMRHQYEDKLMLLTSKIVTTQKERDDVLSFLGSSGDNQTDSKVKRVKEDYESKISNMQREIKKLQQAQREHNHQRQEILSQEVKLKSLRSQLLQLKSSKAQLMRKLAEQNSKHRLEETKKIREIAKLRKEQRKQENTVRSLQAKVQAKENILKRKTEEVTSLRRSQRSSRKSGYGTHFNSRLAWQRWYNISRNLDRVARNKLMIQQFENELERLINERHSLTQSLARIENGPDTSNNNNVNINNNELDNEKDLIKSNLKYIEKSIDNAQQAIMQFEDNKDFNEDISQNVQTMINGVDSIEEAKYLLDRLSTSAIDLLCKVLNVENRLLEQKTLLKETQQENFVQQQLLQHFMAQSNSERIKDLFESLSLNVSKISYSDLSNSEKSLRSNETYDIQTGDENILTDQNYSSSAEYTPELNIKIRCRTAQPHSLLFGEKI